ncbi:hypothetical protein Y032_0410g946 [Ancylostoma ceylanicum]|uniref:C2H2-type domain-containing protein n=2 Tax=Ancylostoma ceylanicum TaxID=53326 RepID=A0A016X2K9_9BILA|nr:hypothetical protein Y032_0410g946 [Ancylostoma ceylanicum]
MKQRETRRKTENEGTVFHSSKAQTSFPLRVCALNATPRNPVDGAHFIHYTVHYCMRYTIHCARTRITHQIDSVNWRSGHQNGHARIRVHGSISAESLMRTADNCCVCGHGPLRLGHLYDHLRKQHKWDEGQIDVKKIEYSHKRNADKHGYECSICGRIYRTNGTLRRHKKGAHAIKVPNSDFGCVICPGCGLNFSSNSDLALHCSEHHYDQINGQDYAIISGEFASKQEFEVTFQDNSYVVTVEMVHFWFLRWYRYVTARKHPVTLR